jgi:putative PIN family toxin of toxin-antitoxin system
VFDNSTLVGAAIRPDSIPDQALQRAILFHRVYASAETLVELEHVLNRTKLARYVSADARRLFLGKFRRDARQCPLPSPLLESVRGVCRDRNDDKFLALCLAARADVLVSSDLDLWVLHPWREIPIVTPAQFLAQFVP